MNTHITNFIQEIKDSFINGAFIRVKISKNRDKKSVLKHITVKRILLKGEDVCNVVYTNKSQDVTKNYSLQEMEQVTYDILTQDCKNAVLFTSKNDITLSANSKDVYSLIVSKPSIKDIGGTDSHDKPKEKLLSVDEEFLQLLKVTSKEGVIIKSRMGKFKQINKFLEVLSNAMNKAGFEEGAELNMLDMGSGKGYLTFASYNYLANILGYSASVRGIEWRQNMVDLCNNISDEVGFKKLDFVQGSIEDYSVESNDILVALHACDTATDDAISKGILSSSRVIILSPCCHKQIRKELDITGELSEITESGIFTERLSEMVTDTLRKMFLELHGYSVQIFEFVPDSYTHKNTMLVAIKSTKDVNKKEIWQRIESFKNTFGVKEFYLETIFTGLKK